MLEKCKKFISFNFLTLASWVNIPIYANLYFELQKFDTTNLNSGSGFWFYWFMAFAKTLIPLFIALVILIFELMSGFRIKNEFILQNRIYNAILIVSLSLYLVLAVFIFYHII